MTVSNITNVASQLARTQESQAKPKTTTTAPVRTDAAASFPVDNVYTTPAGPNPPQVLLSREQATAETISENRVAAQSVLDDSDFEAVAESPQQQVQSQAVASALAQTNRLPANILQLLQE